MSQSVPLSRYPWEDDQLVVTFSTPEQVEVSYRIASFGARFAAAFIDSALFSIVLLAVTVPLMWLLNEGGFADASIVVLILAITANVFLRIAFLAWSEARGDGQTFGKRLLKIRTVMISGHALTTSACIVRNISRIADEVPIFWLVPVFSSSRRRLGDFLAGTLVVTEGSGDLSIPEDLVNLAPSYRALQDRRFVIAAGAQDSLFPDDLNLLEHLFMRTRLVPGRDRRELERQVALKYAARLGAEDQLAQIEDAPRRFLEELYLFLRDRFEADLY